MRQAAAAAAGGQSFPAGALYVVATPIGNLADLSLRAIHLLALADAIACEDTRHSAPLLRALGIEGKPLLAVHEHNEREAGEKLLDRLRCGEAIALISDAGTPAISDPGARVVAAVQAAGFPVIPVPGASAVIAALAASGLSDERFFFAGFLPAKAAARRAEIARLAAVPAALVFYEAPHRIQETVADLAELLGPARQLVVARELTKLFEEIARMPLAEAAAWFAADPNRLRGEFVLAVSAPPEHSGLDAEAERILALLVEALPTGPAARLASEISGVSKNALYRRALELKKDEG